MRPSRSRIDEIRAIVMGTEIGRIQFTVEELLGAHDSLLAENESLKEENEIFRKALEHISSEKSVCKKCSSMDNWCLCNHYFELAEEALKND